MLDSLIAIVANIAAILTAGVAVWLWWKFDQSARSRRKEVEDYLRLERDADKHGGAKMGLRSMEHLVANLAMTEQQINEAIFSSSVVRAWPVYEGQHGDHVSYLAFQYEPKARQMRQRERASTESWIERERKAAEKAGGGQAQSRPSNFAMRHGVSHRARRVACREVSKQVVLMPAISRAGAQGFPRA